MLSDLFSTFDPSMSLAYQLSPVGFWAVTYLMTALIFPSRFVMSSRSKVLIGSASTLPTALIKSSGSSAIQGTAWLLTSLFLMLAAVNLAGLVPWVLSLSSHLVFTAAVALPLWLGSVLASSASLPKKISSLVGSGLPLILAPVIGLIEVLSFFIRPLTLALRLAANMMAGHIIMGLLMGALMSGISLSSPILASVVVGIYLFESAICIVQAYVFILLLSIYIREWAAKTH